MKETRGLDRLKRLFPLAHWQTISGLAQGGVFDINGCWNGIDIWVELKETNRPKTKRGLIRPTVQVGQPAWQALREQAGGRTFVGLMLDSDAGSKFYVLPGSAIRELVYGITQDRLEQLKLDPEKMFS